MRKMGNLLKPAAHKIACAVLTVSAVFCVRVENCILVFLGFISVAMFVTTGIMDHVSA